MSGETRERVGEYVERVEEGGVLVGLQCTVCKAIHTGTLGADSPDPHGVQAVDAAFECHPDGEIDKDPEIGDCVLDTEREERMVVVGRADAGVVIESPTRRILFEQGHLDDEPKTITCPTDRLSVIAEVSEA